MISRINSKKVKSEVSIRKRNQQFDHVRAAPRTISAFWAFVSSERMTFSSRSWAHVRSRSQSFDPFRLRRGSNDAPLGWEKREREK